MSHFPLGDYNFPPPVQYGWICPRCNTVHSPSSMSCWCSATITIENCHFEQPSGEIELTVTTETVK